VWSNVARVQVAVTAEAGLRGAWALDEGSGLVVADGSGWGGSGAVSGGATWAAGVGGSALRFDGVSGRAAVPDSAALDVSAAVTVAAWVRPERLGTQYVVKKAEGYEVDGYELGLASTGRPFFRVNQASAGDAHRASAPAAAPADGRTWTHLVGVYDGTRVRLYVDGVERVSVAGPAAVGTNSLPLVLGDQPGGGYPLRGAVDAVRVYDRALTAAQVATLHDGEAARVAAAAGPSAAPSAGPGKQPSERPSGDLRDEPSNEPTATGPAGEPSTAPSPVSEPSPSPSAPTPSGPSDLPAGRGPPGGPTATPSPTA
jgi:hypothetical protein